MKFRTTAFQRLAQRYGQEAVLVGPDGVGTVTRAFVQPVLRKSESWFQEAFTALGRTEESLFLYLGPAELDPRRAVHVEALGRRLQVRAAELVMAGSEMSHFWALLAPGREEDECR